MSINRKARVLIGALVAAIGFALLAIAPAARGEHDNITGTNVKVFFAAQSVTAGGTATSVAYDALQKTNFQSVALRGVGTSPNFKLEALCTLDGVEYVKPETGGDLGTFTDENWHIVALSLPLCTGMKLKATELGSSNAVAVDAKMRTQ